MKKISVVLLSLVFALSLSLTVAAATMSDADVIKVVGDKKVMEGTDKGFEPEKTLTRAEITAIVVRLKGLENESVVDVDFDDVNKKDWSYKYIAIAYHEGIVQGIGNNKFAPNNEVTIGEAVTMLIRAVADTTGVEGVGNWPDNYMAYGKKLEILTGVKKSAKEKSLRMDTARIAANIITSKNWSNEEEKKETVQKATAQSGIILEVAEAMDNKNLITLAMPGGIIKEYETDDSELAVGTILPGTLISFWLTDNTMWDIEAETVTKVTENEHVIKVIDFRDNLVKCIIKDDNDDKVYQSSDFEWLSIGNILYLKAEELKLVKIEPEEKRDDKVLYTRLYDDLKITDGHDIEYVDDFGEKWDKLDGTEIFYQSLTDKKGEEYIVSMIYTDED